jgi:aminopeptidase YwaD
LAFILFISIQYLFSQTYSVFYQSIVDGVKYDSILTSLQKIETFGVKSPGTTALINAKNWLVNKYTTYGYSNIQIDSFTDHGDALYNVIVNKTGTVFPNTYLIVCGHYDSAAGMGGGSPGVNDNGSGVSIILEIARMLKNVNTEYSIKFINFTAEETGFTGSSNYINNTVLPQNLNIRLVFNIDEVGGIAGQVNNIIKCESDQGNPSSNNTASDLFTDSLRTLTTLYSTLGTLNTEAYGSDYMPFQDEGYIITGYFENNESSVVHTSNDNLAHLDTSYVFEIAKAATGATLYFAKAYNNTSINEHSQDYLISVFPNPVKEQLFINSSIPISKIELFDFQGKKIFETKTNEQFHYKINLSAFSNGIYLYKLSDKNSSIIKTGTIVK